MSFTQAQAAPAQAPTPAVPSPPGAPGAPTVVRIGSDGQLIDINSSDPAQVYRAAQNQRRELRDQLENLEDQRDELRSELASTPGSDATVRSGIEQRISALDARILALDKQIEQADAAVSRAAGIPGAIVPPPPPPPQSGPPEEFWVISGLILVPTAFILSIGYARRLWKKGAAVVTSIPQDVYDRFTRVEQSIDSVAVEVERIGEGQRYLTKLMADRALGAGAAQPVSVRQREADKERVEGKG